MAYEKQSKSLKTVQKFGPGLEKKVREILGWKRGRVEFTTVGDETYDVQIDGCIPNTKKPEAFLSVTYCNPDKPGHSNENKFQLKVGELMLLKAHHPEIRSLLVLGGKEDTWMPYVLEAFQYFFDEVIFLWVEDAEKRLNEISENHTSIELKHEKVWAKIASEWDEIDYITDDPIDSWLRQNIWELLSELGVEGDHPNDISNSVIKRCMEAAYDRYKDTKGRSGTEWNHYVNGRWDKIWQARSYFNPGEAVIQMSLDLTDFAYLGGLAIDVEVPSMLHTLGGDMYSRTKTSEDFLLFSQKFDCPIYLQSKSSGGGLDRHGKNIQNRAKEQITRGLIYRTKVSKDNKMTFGEENFIWIGVLDGNWGITKSTPHKYIHMLQMAGYDYLIAADELVDDDNELLENKKNPLLKLLIKLECIKDKEQLKKSGKNGKRAVLKLKVLYLNRRNWIPWMENLNPMGQMMINYFIFFPL